MDTIEVLLHLLEEQKCNRLTQIRNENKIFNEVIHSYQSKNNSYFKNLSGSRSKSKIYNLVENTLTEAIIKEYDFADSPFISTDENKCLYLFLIFKFLKGSFRNQEAKVIGLKALKLSTKYQIFDIATQVARKLLELVATDNDFVAYTKLREKYRVLNEIFNFEKEVYVLYFDLSAYKIKGTLDKHLEDFYPIYHRLCDTIKPTHSFKSHNVLGLCSIIIDMINKNYQEIITKALKFIVFIEKTYPKKYKVTRATYYAAAINILTYTGKYKEAISKIDIYPMYASIGTQNWFSHQEIFTISFIYAGEYQRAYECAYNAYTHRKFKAQRLQSLEIWTLTISHLALLEKANLIQVYDDDKRIHKFRISKFQNEFTSLSGHKSDFKLSIRISTICHLILNKQFNKLIDDEEAISKYLGRYVIKSELVFRQKCFLKCLLFFPKQNFHPIAIQRHASGLLDKLKSTPISDTGIDLLAEPIPYHILWDIVLQSLDN